MKDVAWGNTSIKQTLQNIPDFEIFGEGDSFKLISKMYSMDQGWMELTKALQIDNSGCLVQVTVYQRNPNQNPTADPTYSASTDLTFVPNVYIEEVRDENSRIVNRRLKAR